MDTIRTKREQCDGKKKITRVEAQGARDAAVRLDFDEGTKPYRHGAAVDRRAIRICGARTHKRQTVAKGVRDKTCKKK